jgi:hypothetical protein
VVNRIKKRMQPFFNLNQNHPQQRTLAQIKSFQLLFIAQ